MVFDRVEKENKTVINIIIGLLLLAILLYVIYPPLRSAVGVYGFILMFCFTVYTNPAVQKYLIGITKSTMLPAFLVGGGVGFIFWITSKLVPWMAFGIPNLPYTVDSNLRWLIICIFAPIGEEILTRGALLGLIKYMQRKNGLTNIELWIAIIVQALFFTLLHLFAYAGNWYTAPTWMGVAGVITAVQGALISAFIFGIVFGYIVTRNGVKNLFASMLAHFIINNILFVSLVIAF